MLMHMKEKEMVTMKESVGNLNFNVKIVISLDILGNVVSMTWRKKTLMLLMKKSQHYY